METGLITIGPAQSDDLAAVLLLLDDNGLPTDGLADHFAHALVAREDEQVKGCAALEIYGTSALLRSVAVDQSLRGQGWGQRLTQAALDYAASQGVREVYLLTETAGGFFPRFGFVQTTRADVPASVRESVEFTTACADTALVMKKQFTM